MMAAEGTKSWTCDRCEVSVQWMVDHVDEDRDLPPNWERVDERLHCLGCRRDIAAEAAETPDDAPLNERVKLQGQARVAFELERDPDRPNGEIAKACHTSGAAVQKARVRLGLVEG